MRSLGIVTLIYSIRIDKCENTQKTKKLQKILIILVVLAAQNLTFL